MLGANGKSVNGAVHRENGSVENVDGVDFLLRGNADGPRSGFAFDGVAQQVALVLAKAFGIVQQLVFISVGEYHGCGKYRSSQAASSGFVASGLYASGFEIREQHCRQVILFMTLDDELEKRKECRFGFAVVVFGKNGRRLVLQFFH